MSHPRVRGANVTALRALEKLDMKDLLTLYEQFVGKLDYPGKQRLLEAARHRGWDRNASDEPIAA